MCIYYIYIYLYKENYQVDKGDDSYYDGNNRRVISTCVK